MNDEPIDAKLLFKCSLGLILAFVVLAVLFTRYSYPILEWTNNLLK